MMQKQEGYGAKHKPIDAHYRYKWLHIILISATRLHDHHYQGPHKSCEHQGSGMKTQGAGKPIYNHPHHKSQSQTYPGRGFERQQKDKKGVYHGFYISVQIYMIKYYYLYKQEYYKSYGYSKYAIHLVPPFLKPVFLPSADNLRYRPDLVLRSLCSVLLLYYKNLRLPEILFYLHSPA